MTGETSARTGSIGGSVAGPRVAAASALGAARARTRTGKKGHEGLGAFISAGETSGRAKRLAPDRTNRRARYFMGSMTRPPLPVSTLIAMWPSPRRQPTTSRRFTILSASWKSQRRSPFPRLARASKPASEGRRQADGTAARVRRHPAELAPEGLHLDRPRAGVGPDLLGLDPCELHAARARVDLQGADARAGDEDGAGPGVADEPVALEVLDQALAAAGVTTERPLHATGGHVARARVGHEVAFRLRQADGPAPRFEAQSRRPAARRRSAPARVSSRPFLTPFGTSTTRSA